MFAGDITVETTADDNAINTIRSLREAMQSQFNGAAIARTGRQSVRDRHAAFGNQTQAGGGARIRTRSEVSDVLLMTAVYFRSNSARAGCTVHYAQCKYVDYEPGGDAAGVPICPWNGQNCDIGAFESEYIPDLIFRYAFE